MAVPIPLVRVLAPAKVNPFLEILGKRADGFHELDTTLLALELADVVAARATRSGTIELRCDGPFASADIPLDARNLAWAAAAAVLEVARARGERDAGLELVVTKNVPSQAGLGGGSADAAAALHAAEHALGVSLDDDVAHAALAKLGSDCVFFREARSSGHARATGRGERIAPLPAPTSELSILVATPAFGAPTAAVYLALTAPLRGGEPAREPAPELLSLAARSIPRPFNRLESAALAAIPELRPWRELLDRVAPERFTLSGSGSSFFAFEPAPDRAAALLTTLRAALATANLPARGLWLTRPARHGAVVVR